MSSFDTAALVVGVTVPSVVVLGGWLVSDRRERRQPGNRTARRLRAVTIVVVAVSALVMAIASPITSVFWAIVALNFVVGRHENIPFSTYPMFSDPNTSAWSLRFEDMNGDAVKIGRMGLAPHIVRKRFASEIRAARARGIRDPAELRRTAGEVVAALVEQHRPPGGPLAACPITIVHVEYILDSGRLRKVRTPVLETTPR